ncbi:MAG: PLDc_N domain-containing protein [Thermomicrobiales bacterium]|nr:PLDc_N domain-containing protein [Thermomicrobiales bacterium]
MDWLAGQLGVSTTVALAIVLLAVVQIGLAVYALVDLWRRERVTGDRKWLWVVMILAGNLAGSIIYLTVGRNVPPEVTDDGVASPTGPVTRSDRIQRGVESLYGPPPS